MGLGSSKNPKQTQNSYDPQSDCIDRILSRNVEPRNAHPQNPNQNCHQPNPNKIHIQDDPPPTQNTQFSYRNPITSSPPSKLEVQRNIWKSNSTQPPTPPLSRPNLRDPKNRPSEDPKNSKFFEETAKVEQHRKFYSVTKATAFTNRFLMNISNDKLNINLNLTSNMLTMVDGSETCNGKIAGLRGNPRSNYRHQRESEMRERQNVKRREIIEYVQESEIDVGNEIEAIQVDTSLLDGGIIGYPIGEPKKTEDGDLQMRRSLVGRNQRGTGQEGGMHS